MLSPIEYIKDCKKIANNQILNNTYLIKVDENESQNLWELKFDASYDYLNANSISSSDLEEFSSFKSSFKYDLENACKRQKVFYYQVSLPHYRNRDYLNLCLQRYKKFLYLKKYHKADFLVPCFGNNFEYHI
jgi:hypothetical protein